MSDHYLSGASRRRWEMWREHLPEAGPPLKKMDGNELVIAPISQSLALSLLEKLSIQEDSNLAMQEDIREFRTVVEKRQHHDLFVIFWPHSEGPFGRVDWVACIELWANEREAGGSNSCGFSLGSIAAQTEHELARRLGNYLMPASTIRLSSNGWEAISTIDT